MAVAAGIDVRTAVEVVRTGGASNFFIDRAVEGINQRNKPAQFALGLAAKDAHLIQEVADGRGVSAAIAAAMVEVLDDVVERGLGDHDWSDLVRRRRGSAAASSSRSRPKAGGLMPQGPHRGGLLHHPRRSRRGRRAPCSSAAAARPAASTSSPAAWCARSASTRAATTWSSAPPAASGRGPTCHVPLFAKKDAEVDAYGVGQVDLPGGPAHPGDPRRRPRRLRDRHGARARPRDAAAPTPTATTS